MIIIHYFLLINLLFLSQHDFVFSITTPDKVISYGYPLEIHHLKTEDDALIGMTRIPHGKHFNGIIGKPVIFIGALLSASFAYVITNHSLAFNLADAGFDVWLMDYRAMGISKDIIDPRLGKKRKLSRMNWNYSIHELGVYDFPASVDYILKHTKYSKVDVISVSLGSFITLLGLSERPEYNQKIRNNVMIAPSARNLYILNNRPLLKTVARIWIPMLITILKRTKYITLPNSDNNIAGTICKNIFFRYQCMATFILFQGIFSPIDYNVIADVMTTFPQPTSSKYWIHVFQLLLSGRFQNYDYGPKENMKHYNSSIVPEYNITKVTAPSIIVYSKADLVTSPSDMKWLLHNMPNIKDTYFIQKVPFSHLGFLLGKKSHIVVNPYVVKKLLESD